MRSFLPFLVLGFFHLSQANIRAGRYHDVEADQSTMLTGGKQIQTHGEIYDIATKHDVGLNVFYPAISTASALPGHHSSFEFRMDPHPGKTTPGEKTHVNLVVANDPHSPVWGQANAVAFSVCLASDYDLQTKAVQLCEWWQGSPYGAPLGLVILPGTTQWSVEIQNSDNNSQGVGSVIPLPGNVLKINQWYTFVIRVVPRFDGPGEVTVWQDGVQVIDHKTDPIGFNPAAGVGKRSNLPLKKFFVCVGAYRPANTHLVHLYEDALRWGDDYADVAVHPAASP